MKSTFWSLRHPGFRILWLGMVTGGISQWAMTVGRAWLVFELSDSAFAVAVVTFSGFFGTFVMVPFGGILADRLDRRALLFSSMIAPMVANLLLAAVTVTGVVEVWQVFFLSLIASFGRAMGQPASRALTPNLVPPEDLLNAVSLRNAAMRGPRVFGPLIAAPLLAGVGAEGVFLFSAVLYSIAASMILRLPKVGSPRPVGATSTIASEFKEGFRYVTRVSPVNLMVAFVATHCAMTMSFDSLLPSLSREELGGDEALFSYLFMAVGAGGLIATLSIASIRESSARGRALLATALLSGLSLVIVALSQSPAAALIGLLLAGGSQAAFMSMSEVLLLEVVPDRLRGRAMGVYTMNNAGMMAVFALVNGYFADLWHVQGVLLVLGLSFTLLTMATFGVSGRLRWVYGSGALEQRQTAAA
jgi:MFS family permease